jgi:endonuclease YncB( thermonuclease family)
MLTFLTSVAIAGSGQPPPGGWPPPPEAGTVANCYDGDTCTLDSGDKIRLRWVNTPELKPAEPYGPEARDAANLFLKASRVGLIIEDPANARDGYGRIVAGLETDAGNLSIHLLEKGMGHLFIIPPDATDLAPFLEAQEKARRANRGIWSTDRYQGALHITSFHANAAGDDRENVNGEYLRICNVTSEAMNVDGFRIAKANGKSWTFPALVIPAGHTVKVHSGQGEHQGNAADQLAIFLGSPTPIWSNSGDSATVYDRFGRVVDSVTRSGDGGR